MKAAQSLYKSHANKASAIPTKASTHASTPLNSQKQSIELVPKGNNNSSKAGVSPGTVTNDKNKSSGNPFQPAAHQSGTHGNKSQFSEPQPSKQIHESTIPYKRNSKLDYSFKSLFDSIDLFTNALFGQVSNIEEYMTFFEISDEEKLIQKEYLSAVLNAHKKFKTQKK